MIIEGCLQQLVYKQPSIYTPVLNKTNCSVTWLHDRSSGNYCISAEPAHQTLCTQCITNATPNILLSISPIRKKWMCFTLCLWYYCWFYFSTWGINGGTAVAVGQTETPMEHREVQGWQTVTVIASCASWPRPSHQAMSVLSWLLQCAGFALQHMECISSI